MSIERPQYPEGVYIQNVDTANQVNWPLLKRLGYTFVIARASHCDQLSEGGPYDVSNYVDQSIRTAAEKCAEMGLYLILWHELGTRPNVHAVDWKTPGNGHQYRSLQYASQNKTYQGVAVGLVRAMNTGSNMAEMLKQFLGVIETCKMQKEPAGSGIKTPPIIVGCTPTVWWSDGKEVENVIGQKNFPHDVAVFGSINKRISPGNLPTSNNLIHAFGYTNEFMLSGFATQLRYYGSYNGWKETFGEIANYDYEPEIPGGEDPGNGGTEDPPGSTVPPGTEPTTSFDLTGTNLILSEIRDRLSEINETFKDIARL